MGIAIAISAVATTNTRNTSAAPAAEAVCCANVTRLRFTPLSISSMHISMTCTLRRAMTPSSPSAKSAADTLTSICTLSTTPSHFEHRERRDDRSDQQHRDELELQPVLVQEFDREGLDAGQRASRRTVGVGQPLPQAER